MKDIRGIPGEKVGHATVTESRRTVIREGAPVGGTASHWTTNIKGSQSRVPGTANKTEAQYGLHLDDLMRAGEVLWWRFHPFRLRISDTPSDGGGKALYYSPDFLVVFHDRVEVHETKGNFTSESAWAVLRAASEVFPLFTFARVRKVKGEWTVERL